MIERLLLLLGVLRTNADPELDEAAERDAVKNHGKRREVHQVVLLAVRA